MMHWLVVNLLFYFLTGSHGAQATGRGFVGLDDDGNLALKPPFGRQLVVDGVALIKKLADMEALILEQQSTILQQQSTITQLNATVAELTSAQGQGRTSDCVPANEHSRDKLGFMFNGTIHTIDSTGNVGQYTSLALTTAGFPVISYRDVTNGDLKLAVCGDATCSSSTTIRTIDSAGDVGWYTSLALTTAGFPVVSYYDGTSQNLKLAVCADATCLSSTAIRIIDSTGGVGSHTSLALTTAGFPVILYRDFINRDLKLAVCADATCSSGTIIRTIDSMGDVGQYTSLALTTAGIPVISYYDVTNQNLKLAVCADATCLSNTTFRTIDGTGNKGEFTSLALTTAGFPVISYRDVTNGDLKLAVCGDATCSSSTTIRTIDSAGDVGWYTSLALTTAGFPVISFYDITNSGLKLAVCADTTCSSSTTIRTIDSAGSVGWYLSLALTTAGFPVISYYDKTNGDLKLAVCADVTCSSGTAIRTIDSTSDVGGYTSLALTTAGFPVISYYATTNGDLKLAVCADATCSSGTTIRTIDSTGDVGHHTSLALTTAGFPVIS